MAEHVGKEIHGVHTHQGRRVRLDTSLHQGRVLGAVQQVAVDEQAKIAAIDAGERLFEHPLDELVVAAAVGNQIGDGADFHPVGLGEGDQIGQARHRPVVVHHLADHPGRIEPRQARDIHRRLGMARAHQHAAVLGYQRKDVPRADHILGALGQVDGHRHGAGAVMGRDAGGHALARLDGHGEGGGVLGLVLEGHGRQPQLPGAIGGDGQADQAARMLGHEIDLLGRGHLSGDDHIPLILTVLGVHENVRPALAGVLDDVFDGGNGIFWIHVQRGLKGFPPARHIAREDIDLDIDSGARF